MTNWWPAGKGKGETIMSGRIVSLDTCSGHRTLFLNAPLNADTLWPDQAATIGSMKPRSISDQSCRGRFDREQGGLSEFLKKRKENSAGAALDFL